MTKYPIDVLPLKPYYGDDPKKQRKFAKDLRIAQKIAEYINCKMKTDYKNRESAIFTFGKIALALGLEERKVQSYLHGYLGSSDNAIKILND